ncbi:hypothetical protein OROGR_027046 [Orobanche gracilis]
MNRPGDWNCVSCQHHNFQRRDSCQRCYKPRPGSRESYSNVRFGGQVDMQIGSPGPDVRPGDWYCSVGNCEAHNFANRSSCFKCGAQKNDGSSGGVGGFDGDLLRYRARGLSGDAGGVSRTWKSGDWLCTRFNCNEHNFASRTECFKCNAPKDLSGNF